MEWVVWERPRRCSETSNTLIYKDCSASGRHLRPRSTGLLIPVVAGSDFAGDTMKALPRNRLRVLHTGVEPWKTLGCRGAKHRRGPSRLRPIRHVSAVTRIRGAEFSWYLKRQGRTIGRHFDHVYASRNLRPVSRQCLHELRELGMSDHSPVEVCLALDENGQ